MAKTTKVIALRWKLKEKTGRDLLIYAPTSELAERNAREAGFEDPCVFSGWGNIEEDAHGRQAYNFPDRPHVAVDVAPARERETRT